MRGPRLHARLQLGLDRVSWIERAPGRVACARKLRRGDATWARAECARDVISGRVDARSPAACKIATRSGQSELDRESTGTSCMRAETATWRCDVGSSGVRT